MMMVVSFKLGPTDPDSKLKEEILEAHHSDSSYLNLNFHFLAVDAKKPHRSESHVAEKQLRSYLATINHWHFVCIKCVLSDGRLRQSSV